MSPSAQETIRQCLTLLLVPGVGPLTLRRLLSHFGSLDGVMGASYGDLLRVQGVGEATATALVRSKPYHLADRELAFAERHGIAVYCALLEEYPARLRHCEDAPILLYYSSRDPFPFGESKWLSIVGTRRATPYGREFVRQLLESLQERGHMPVVVSGLAFGIDAEAHRVALELGMKTVAVLGHGLANLYPAQHRELALMVRASGGLLTEYPSSMEGEKSTFIQRNRVIAGLSEATIVVESGVRGGAMATARMAFDYNREVFALPGAISRETSGGCHALIKQNRAALIEGAEDLVTALNWEVAQVQQARQASLFYVPTPEEQELIEALGLGGPKGFDELARAARIPINRLNAMLLNLEFKGFIRQLPGRNYEVVR